MMDRIKISVSGWLICLSGYWENLFPSLAMETSLSHLIDTGLVDIHSKFEVKMSKNHFSTLFGTHTSLGVFTWVLLEPRWRYIEIPWSRGDFYAASLRKHHTISSLIFTLLDMYHYFRLLIGFEVIWRSQRKNVIGQSGCQSIQGTSALGCSRQTWQGKQIRVAIHKLYTYSVLRGLYRYSLTWTL